MSWSWNKTGLKNQPTQSGKQFYCKDAIRSICVQQTAVCPLVISSKNILSARGYRQNNKEHSSIINMPTERWVPWMHPIQLAASEFIALEQSPLFYVCDGQPVCGCLSIVHQSWSACLWMSQHCASWSACLWLSECCASVLVSLSMAVKVLRISLCQPAYGC